MTRDESMVYCLRRDLALQVARAVRRLATTQSSAAKQFGVPQPTISKIINGQVDSLSIEILIRMAVRKNLSLAIHLGEVPEEAGVYVSKPDDRRTMLRHGSPLADHARLA